MCPVKLLAIWRARSLASDLVGGGEGEGRGRGSGGEELMVNGSRGSLSSDTDTQACMVHRHICTYMYIHTCSKHSTWAAYALHMHCICTAHGLHMGCTCTTHVLPHRHTITPPWGGGQQKHGFGSVKFCIAFRQSHQVQGRPTRYHFL